MISLTTGPVSSEETVDTIQSAVGSAETRTLLHALHVVHRHLHHRGARVHVPSWLQQRTLERQTIRRLRAGGPQDGRDVRLTDLSNTNDSRKVKPEAPLSECSQAPPSQSSCADNNRTSRVRVSAPAIVLRDHPPLRFNSLQLCFCELRRKQYSVTGSVSLSMSC